MIKHLLERELHLDIKRVQGRQKAKGIYTNFFFVFENVAYFIFR